MDSAGPLLQMLLISLLSAYVGIGIAVALAFVTVGVVPVQPMSVTVGARILLLPSTAPGTPAAIDCEP